MTHLSADELVDLVEGTLGAERAVHAASCERCRRDADGLATALREARGADLPEPSPLFWEGFSARVQDAIDATPSPRRLWPSLRWGLGITGAWKLGTALAAAALVITLAIDGGLRRDAPPPGERESVAQRGTPTAPLEQTPEADPEWSFVASMADGIDWDAAQAAGLVVRPGAAERAALLLSGAEQTELARLLREEMSGVEGSL
jgi:hypothetical protein